MLFDVPSLIKLFLIKSRQFTSYSNMHWRLSGDRERRPTLWPLNFILSLSIFFIVMSEGGGMGFFLVGIFTDLCQFLHSGIFWF